jgi:hypothetical protein
LYIGPFIYLGFSLMNLVKIGLAFTVAAGTSIITTSGLWAHDPEEKAEDRQHDEQTGAELSAQTAWSTIQNSVKDMERAVTSKNLKGIHSATVKIMPALKALQAHCKMLTGDLGLRLDSSLKALRSAVIEFHHERNDGDQARAEAQLTKVQAAFREVESQSPESLFNLGGTNRQGSAIRRYR